MKDISSIENNLSTRGRKGLDEYYKEISQYKPLSPEEEVLLAKKIKQGDKDALEKLILANLKFVSQVAGEYKSRKYDEMDLISAGNMGMREAALKFDETTGNKFISYARWWVQAYIIKFIEEHGRTVRLPQNKIKDVLKIKETAARLEQILQHDPTPEQIAAEIETSAESVILSQKDSQYSASLDSPVSSDGSEQETFANVQPSKEKRHDVSFEQSYLGELLKPLLLRLKPREQIIVEHHYGLNGKQKLDNDSIGELVGLGSERIRQIIQNETKKKLQKLLDSDPDFKRVLADYL